MLARWLSQQGSLGREGSGGDAGCGRGHSAGVAGQAAAGPHFMTVVAADRRRIIISVTLGKSFLCKIFLSFHLSSPEGQEWEQTRTCQSAPRCGPSSVCGRSARLSGSPMCGPPAPAEPPCIILGVGPAPGAPHPTEPRPGPAQQTETTKSLQSVLMLTFD